MGELSGCTCDDCDGGCSMLADEEICDECSMGIHEQDRSDDD
jgi:hypothetical protein